MANFIPLGKVSINEVEGQKRAIACLQSEINQDCEDLSNKRDRLITYIRGLKRLESKLKNQK
jgi:hypothetical protein